MPGLVPGIHVLRPNPKSWMAGTCLREAALVSYNLMVTGLRFGEGRQARP
jgi:hypothetical protein